MKRTKATGEWTVLVRPDFDLINNGDSWQAHKGDRVVYVSSLSLKDPTGGKMSAQTICATAVKQFGKTGGERVTFSSGGLRGEAEIIRVEGRWQLKGIMCADGTLATCVIDYSDQKEKAWAVSTWRSLEHR